MGYLKKTALPLVLSVAGAGELYAQESLRDRLTRYMQQQGVQIHRQSDGSTIIYNSPRSLPPRRIVVPDTYDHLRGTIISQDRQKGTAKAQQYDLNPAVQKRRLLEYLELVRNKHRVITIP